MGVITETVSLFWEALFLRPDPYATMRDKESPASKGFLLLVVLGLLLAAAGFIGSLLAWASSPDLMAVRDVVLRNLQQMDWWELMSSDPEAEAIWFQIWDPIWQFIGVFTPSPVSGLAGFVVQPLTLVLSWLLFGTIAHVMAKIFGGQGDFGQTLGATSLAAAPQLLGMLHVVPFLTLAGIGVWTLLARYMAIRVTHGLSWGRSVWVTILTMLVLYVLAFFVAGAIGAVSASLIAASFAGG